MIVRDGEWSLYDYNQKLGRQIWMRRNADGSTTMRTDYEVQPTIDINRAQRNISQKGWAGDYHQVASVPLNIYLEQVAEAQKQGDEGYVSKWLNDSDNRAWRTKDGRV